MDVSRSVAAMRDFVKYVLLLLSISPRCQCKLEPYIVGGQYAKIRNFPHAVYLSAECDCQWICGSSVLNQRIILTAGHCLDGCKLNLRSHSIEAYAGHENIQKAQVSRSVIYMIIHPHYEPNQVTNDIGLAMVAKNLPLGNVIKRVIIPMRFTPDMVNASVAGWGVTNDQTGDGTLILKSVRQRVRSSTICSQIGTLEKGMFCAGSTTSNTNYPASGDSGSAFITDNFQEIGLVSFKVNILPALMVYTNVTYYYKWIHNNSKTLFCRAKGK